MAKVFFLGAGSSAEAGYPITKWLTYPVAAYLLEYRRRNPGQTSRLEQYLATTYSVTEAALVDPAKLWRRFVDTERGRPPEALPDSDFMPSIIEILSILDIAIAEGWSFGPSRTPRAPGGTPREFKGNELNRVRDRLLGALVIAFSDLAEARGGHAAIDLLASRIGANDTVVTTNWDTLLDDALKQATGVPPAYGTLDARLVDVSGRDLPDQHPSGARRLYKLHGSFNWQTCPRCGDLYVNTVQMIAPTEELQRYKVDRTCHCGAEMDSLIVTPSFIKRYANLHLSNIWRGAQRALEKGKEWIFVGYSLPDDDLWIRAMLLRAVAIRRGKKKGLTVHVVTRREDAALERRYRQLFPEGINFHPGGLQAFLEERAASGGSVQQTELDLNL